MKVDESIRKVENYCVLSCLIPNYYTHTPMSLTLIYLTFSNSNTNDNLESNSHKINQDFCFRLFKSFSKSRMYVYNVTDTIMVGLVSFLHAHIFTMTFLFLLPLTCSFIAEI